MNDENLLIYGKKEAVNKEERTAVFVISNETKDRHGTVIKLNGWELENYSKNPIVAYAHMVNSGNADNIIGVGDVFIEENKLMGRVKFEPAEINPLAEKIFQKVLFGSLNTTSVGFMPKKGHWGNKEQGEDEDTYYFDRSELYEFSVVDLPSNPDAIVQKNFEVPKKDKKASSERKKGLTLQQRNKFKILKLKSK
jgi:HK97 family phage prohead protease